MAAESPQDLNQQLKQFCDNMKTLEQMSAQFSDFYFELMDQPDNRDNVWSKLDANVTCSVANASLYYIYLTLKGAEMKDHPIKDEITRVRKYYQELELLKKDAPKLNVRAAKNFIKNALWDPTQNPAGGGGGGTAAEADQEKPNQAKPYQKKSHYFNNSNNKDSKKPRFNNNKRKRR